MIQIGDKEGGDTRFVRTNRAPSLEEIWKIFGANIKEIFGANIKEIFGTIMKPILKQIKRTNLGEG